MESQYEVSSKQMVEEQIGMQNDKRKIVINVYSHVRNCAAELQQQLGRKHVVSGYVKSSAGMKVIVASAKEEIGKLKGEDVVVVWGDQMILVKAIPRRR
jgi:hypothetical protein